MDRRPPRRCPAIALALDDFADLADAPRLARRARRIHRRLARAVDPVVAQHGAVDLALVGRLVDGVPVHALAVVTPVAVVVAYRRRLVRAHTATLLFRRASVRDVSVTAGARHRSTRLSLATAGSATRLDVAGRSPALERRLLDLLSPRRG